MTLTTDPKLLKGGWAILTHPNPQVWKLHALFARPQDAEGFGRTRNVGGRPYFLELPGECGRAIAQMIADELFAPFHEPQRTGYAVVTSPGAGQRLVAAVFASKAYALEFHGLIPHFRSPEVHTIAATVWKGVQDLVVAEAFAYVAGAHREITALPKVDPEAKAAAEAS